MPSPDPDGEAIRDIYDALAEDYNLLLPHLSDLIESYSVIVELIPHEHDDRFRVIDIGIGPGLLSEMIADTFPNAHITGVDISLQMLECAKRRLERFRPRVELLQADVTQSIPGGPYHVAVSANALVYRNMRLADCYKRIRSKLVPGGVFLNSTLIAAENPEIEDAITRSISSRRAALDPNLVKRLQEKGSRVSTFGDNSLAAAYRCEEHLEFFNKSSFDSAAMIWRHRSQALFFAAAGTSQIHA